ncbi:MAG TPA: PSD1 and planctomycete cytochrome C domain-containing protein [Pirellulales bacterium]|jgi:mono/diheme cytochrome c family protein
MNSSRRVNLQPVRSIARQAILATCAAVACWFGHSALLAASPEDAPVETGKAVEKPIAEKPSETPPAAKVDFRRDVQPLLAQRCYRCHGPDQAKGGLRLNKKEAALAEIDSGERAITPGKPDESALLARVTSEDEGVRMPPEGKPLTPEQVRVLSDWIAAGAEWPNYWAFETVKRPPVPAAPAGNTWPRTPIDNFILDKLAARGFEPARPAEKVSLLRRVYYDLIGLPPTPEQVDAFLADTRDDAYERTVDQLLVSPQYGERWARHWLDLVRYADTNSFERDGEKPNAWRYRDYVIRSLNDDKPYDQFIREQLAGDELERVTPDTLTATGYYRLGLWDDEPADLLQARFDELDDIVATTSQVFLGLTVNCARCHDHKLDPIPQADYYQLVAFFGEIDRYKTDKCQTDISSPEVAAQYQQLADRRAALRDKMTPIEQSAIVKLSSEEQRKTEGPEREKVLKKRLRAHLSDEAWAEYSDLKQQFDDAEKTKLPPRESVLSIGPCMKEPPKTFILARGNPHVPGAEVEPAFLTALGGGKPTIPARPADAKSSGRRRALADWIASPTNPLTARVMANRLWQHHFGRGLVRSSSNFGSLGNPPTHPELLDWLAAELAENGWRLKPLHRMMVTSAAYRMSSSPSAKALAEDPENDLYAQFDMRRLGAEEVRDSMLAVSGLLNPKMFGPGIYPQLSDEVLQSQSMPGHGWGKSSPEERARRSVYIFSKRSLVVPLLAEFDVSDTDSSCAVRFATTQPTQALAMLNGDFAHEQAAALAARLRREAPNDLPRQVRRALRLTLSAPVEPRKVEQGLLLIDTLQTKHGLSADNALQDFCLMALNLNEFIYLD